MHRTAAAHWYIRVNKSKKQNTNLLLCISRVLEYNKIQLSKASFLAARSGGWMDGLQKPLEWNLNIYILGAQICSVGVGVGIIFLK